MKVYKIQAGSTAPDYIEYRRCPKDSGHWKTEGERCPVCHSKIEALLYIYTGVIADEPEVAAMTNFQPQPEDQHGA